jgi:hypothetical protein
MGEVLPDFFMSDMLDILQAEIIQIESNVKLME